MSIKIWDLTSYKCKSTIYLFEDVNCLVKMNQSLFMSGTSDFLIHLWNLANNTCLIRFDEGYNEIHCLIILNECQFACGCGSLIKLYVY